MAEEVKDNIKNSIFWIEGGIGHTFCMSAVFKKYKETFPNRNIIVFAPWLTVLHRNEHIDDLYDVNDYLAKENIFKKGNFIIHNPNVYREYLHHRCDDHIKTILGEQCGVEVKRKDKLYYFPTNRELRSARKFKRDMCDGKLLGIVQCEGSGFDLMDQNTRQLIKNPLRTLKELPKETANEILKQTSDKIFWVQIRLPNEIDLEAEYELVDFDHRLMFALLSVADIGFGTDSFSQHVMSGIYNIPYVMVYGRSKAKAYCHPATIPVGNPDSCPAKKFECDFPLYDIPSLCGDVDCMKSITSEQVIKEINKAIAGKTINKTEDKKVVEMKPKRKRRRKG